MPGGVGGFLSISVSQLPHSRRGGGRLSPLSWPAEGGSPPTPGVDGTALGATSLEGLSGGAPAFGGSSQESSCQAASFQQI